jgi:hypothetical protein
MTLKINHQTAPAGVANLGQLSFGAIIAVWA